VGFASEQVEAGEEHTRCKCPNVRDDESLWHEERPGDPDDGERNDCGVRNFLHAEKAVFDEDDHRRDDEERQDVVVGHSKEDDGDDRDEAGSECSHDERWFTCVPTDQGIRDGSRAGEPGDQANQGSFDVHWHAIGHWLHQTLSARRCDK